MTFSASLRSELRKIKGNYLIYMVLITAFIIPFVLVFDHGSPDSGRPFNGWDNFYKEGTMVMVFAFLPLFYVLASTMLLQIEIRNNTWKQVLASPQSFFHILFAKFTLLHLIALSFIVTYNVYMVLSAVLMDVIFGMNSLSYLEQWREVLKINALAYGSTIGISAVTFWLALRSKNFIAPIALGLLLWVMHLFAALEFHWPHADKFVFAIHLTIFSKKFEHDRVFYQLLSIGYGVFFFSLAYLEFVLQRKKIAWFWKKNVMPAKTLSSVNS
jgi:lantibiotic transport system permease protein